MARVPFKKLRPSAATGQILRRMGDATAAALDPLVACQLLDGRLLTRVALKKAATPNIVPHGLGRTLIGWFPVRIRSVVGPIGFVDAQDGAPFPGPPSAVPINPAPWKTLFLGVSDDCTVDLWVF